MQKAQKHVSKIIFLFLILFINNINAQLIKDDYYFLDKIIQFNSNPNDSVFNLSNKNDGSKYLLKKYYEFRYYDKPFFKVFKYDSINDKVGYDTIRLLKDNIKWRHKYKVLDSLFTKEDIERIIDTKEENIKWDSTNVIFHKYNFSIKWCDSYYCKNSISKTYYNQKKNHAFIIANKTTKGNSTLIYIFKKEDNDWNLLNIIENVGW